MWNSGICVQNVDAVICRSVCCFWLDSAKGDIYTFIVKVLDSSHGASVPAHAEPGLLDELTCKDREWMGTIT